MNNKLSSQRGVTLLDAIMALVLIALVGWILVKVFQIAGSYIGQSREKDKLLSLSSRMNDALLDSKNYRPFSAQLSASPAVLPSSIPFMSRVSSTQELKMGDLNNAGPSKSFFNSELTPCVRSAETLDCKFYVELKWSTSASALPPAQVLLIEADVGIEPLNKTSKVFDTLSFEIPKAFYTTTKELKCPPSTGSKTYLGIRIYDAVNQTRDCWFIDSAKQCPNGTYPNHIIPNANLDPSDPRKDPDPNSSEVHFFCKPLYGVSCTDGFAPQKIYPLDFANSSMLDNACVSIFKDKINQPRLSHIVKQVTESQEGNPANTNGYYGLKWLNGRPCPHGYRLKAKGTYIANIVSDFRDIFILHNSETKSICSGNQANCGEDNGSLFCDSCPISDPARMDGCNFRDFPTSDPSPTVPYAGCNDPKIYAINNSALDAFKNNYECIIDPPAKYKNGLGIILGATSP